MAKITCTCGYNASRSAKTMPILVTVAIVVTTRRRHWPHTTKLTRKVTPFNHRPAADGRQNRTKRRAPPWPLFTPAANRKLIKRWRTNGRTDDVGGGIRNEWMPRETRNVRLVTRATLWVGGGYIWDAIWRHVRTDRQQDIAATINTCKKFLRSQLQSGEKVRNGKIFAILYIARQLVKTKWHTK